MKKISLGIIGCGAMGVQHIKNFSSMDEIGEIMICDTSKRRINLIKRRYKIKKAFDNPEEIVSNVDAVCISTPNSLHFKHALAAIKAGRDVLIEKPMTTNSAEGKILVDAAINREVILAVGCQKRFKQDYQHLKQFVRQGRIGKPIL